jgi:hypothetical protein
MGIPPITPFIDRQNCFEREKRNEIIYREVLL